MCHPLIYKALPYILGFISLIELVLGILRWSIFFSSKSSLNSGNSTTGSYNKVVESPLRLSSQSSTAFVLDSIGSIVSILMGIYLFIFFLVAVLCSVSTACVLLFSACTSRANHRFLSLTCNFPCYKARPQLRFQIRLALMIFFILLRIIAVILYATDQTTGVYGKQIAEICGTSIILVGIVIIIDFYQYRMWWYYRPKGAYKICRCCCWKQHFHPSHERFLPFPLTGINRKVDQLGNQPCQYTVSGNCPILTLEHIVIFHAFDYMPQRRYLFGSDLTYIAFHQTTPEAAVSIAREGFRISQTPPQMLGFGVYFARSFAGTQGKARSHGALICAQIELGRVLRVTHDQLHTVRDSNSWWANYDTVYYAHNREKRDEFCLKSPEQILKWIIVMDDDRIRQYGLDKEYSDTLWGFI